MELSRSIFSNSIYTIFRQCASIVLGFFTILIIARILGPEGQGVYTFLVLIPLSAQTLLSCGIPFSTVYYIGKNKHKLKNIIGTNIFSGFILGLISFFSCLIFIYVFPNDGINKVPYILLWIVLLTVIPIIIHKNISSIFQGLEDFKSYNVIAIANQIFMLSLVIIFVVILSWGIKGALLSFILANLLTFISAMFFLNKSNILYFSFDKKYFFESTSFGLKGHISNIITFFNYRMDIFLIAYFLDNIAVGLYGLAISLAERIWVVSSAVSSVVYSRLANIPDKKQRMELTAKVGRIVLMVSLILGLLLAIAIVYLIPLFFGDAYNGTVQPLLIIIPGVLMMSIARIFANYFTASGRPEINSIVAIICTIVNLILNFILIPKLGIIGAASATTISYTLNLILRAVWFWNMSQFSFAKLFIINKQDIYLLRQKILSSRILRSI